MQKRDSVTLNMPIDLTRLVLEKSEDQARAFHTASAIYSDPETLPLDKLKALTLLTFWSRGEWGSERLKRIIELIGE